MDVYSRLEPVGAKGPTFSIEATAQTFKKPTGISFALLCPAQAFPVPKYR